MDQLVERLGYGAKARVLIVSLDELGFCQAANAAIYAALRDHRATSASLMVPAPWARAAAFDYGGEDLGVHLTLNSELDRFRFGPITQAPSLLDGDGGFPRTIADVWEHADLDEVHREWRAQIERALLWGFEVNHLDAHLGGVELKPEFFDIYLELALEYSLALRLPAIDEERRIGFPFRQLARDAGVVAPDRVLSLSSLGSSAEAVEASIAALEPGVTEVHLHPALDTPELRAADPDWHARVEDAELLAGLDLARLSEACGIVLGGYRLLRPLIAA